MHPLLLAPLDNGIAVACQELTPATQLLFDALEPYPAFVVNAHYDLLAHNRIYESASELDDVPIEERNALWLIFTHPGWRRANVDGEDSAARMVAQFRAAMAEHLAEPAGKSLVARLHRAAPEFTAL